MSDNGKDDKASRPVMLPYSKRGPEDIKRDRARIAELKNQFRTDAEIAEIISEETGVELSRRQINYDLNKMRQDWMNREQDNMQLYMSKELERLDDLEEALWRALRSSMQPKGRVTTTKAPAQVEVEKISKNGQTYTAKETKEIRDEDDLDLVITQVIEMVESQEPNPTYFAQIHSVQQERRRLLGLYPDARITLHKKEVILRKTYHVVSPDDWPDPERTLSATEMAALEAANDDD